MKIALTVETSSKHHARDLWDVVSGLPGQESYWLGLHDEEEEEPLNFLHTSVIAGVLLNVKAVDFVIGGCGSGQGFFNGVMMFPNVLCGLCYDPLEAWLFMQVNAGNCISLPMNRGWGLAGKENVRLILEQAFSAPYAGGYPPERAAVIRDMHGLLRTQSNAFRKSFTEILPLIDRSILLPALRADSVRSLIEGADESAQRDAVCKIYREEIDQ